MKEAYKIFAHYKINAGCPPIEEILFNQEDVMRMQAPDYTAFNENARKRVPTNALVDSISEINHEFSLSRNGLGDFLKNRLTSFHQRNTYNDELVVQYMGPKEEYVPPALDKRDLFPLKFSPFDYFCLPQRKLAAERREYEMRMDDLPYLYYDNT